MAKPKRVFACKECGATQARWAGKCPDCGTWDSLEEQVITAGAKADPHAALAWSIEQAREGHAGAIEQGSAAVALEDLDGKQLALPRLPTGISELDRVLGESKFGDKAVQGLVPGSAVLLGGEPGIGKSTLLLQAARGWARSGQRVLYVSSEESVEQVAQRAGRVEGSDRAGEEAIARHLFLLHDTNLARIIEQARTIAPAVLIIDSIQMVYKGDVSAAPGSITQLRRCATELTYLAKLSGMAVLLVGHVTKDGVVAGPRLLEHVVDCVLTFEGDRTSGHRLVRGIKNRFGSTLEVGLFEMTSLGLAPATDGGRTLLEHARVPRVGSVLCPVMTGSRTMLVEVQALTATGFFGAAKRKSSGLDANRLAMLIAVLEQHADLRLSDRDVFVSSVGGMRVVEPASDLALLLAIASAHLRRPVPASFAACGEIGLGGEVRPVPQLAQRVREAARLGVTDIAIPARTSEAISAPKGVTLHKVKTAVEAQGVLG